MPSLPLSPTERKSYEIIRNHAKSYMKSAISNRRFKRAKRFGISIRFFPGALPGAFRAGEPLGSQTFGKLRNQNRWQCESHLESAG